MVSITRIFDIPLYQQKKYNLPDDFVTKSNGEWVKTSTAEYIDKANKISRALLKMGVKRGDKIAIISSANRTEWHILDIGVMQIGAQTVPIYPTISEEDYAYIINHSDSIYCFVCGQTVADKVSSVRKKIPAIKEVYSFDELPNTKNWKEVLDLGEETTNQEEVEKIKDTIQPDDMATIIYTSGTTGRPKGVMLSHKNIVTDMLSCAPRIPFPTTGEVHSLSFLPSCHIFERMVLYLYQYSGVTIYFGESIDRLGDNLREIKPQVITAVPRLLEKVYSKILSNGSQLPFIKKKIFHWAISVGQRYEPDGANGILYAIELKIARKLVFSKWKEALGGNLKHIISGSAALRPNLIRVFTAAGIKIMEGYGLTETSPVIAVNSMEKGGVKFGTVGRVIDGLDVIIAEDGEILCKGDTVMLGYYKDEKMTAESFKNGYLCTGDIGEIDKDGFLKITDRKKEMFKTSGGKYVAPQQIENYMKQCRFIEQIIVIGDGEKMPASIIQPNFEMIKLWAKKSKIKIGNTNEEIITNKKVLNIFQQEIDKINKKFGKWEQIKLFELTPDVWSIEGGQLTPTMKLKRKKIIEIYQHLYDKIYKD